MSTRKKKMTAFPPDTIPAGSDDPKSDLPGNGDPTSTWRFLHAADIPPVTRKPKYPFNSLVVAGADTGQCLAFTGKTLTQVRSLAYAAAKRYGMKFTVRQLDGGAVGVWRTE